MLFFRSKPLPQLVDVLQAEFKDDTPRVDTPEGKVAPAELFAAKVRRFNEDLDFATRLFEGVPLKLLADKAVGEQLVQHISKSLPSKVVLIDDVELPREKQGYFITDSEELKKAERFLQACVHMAQNNLLTKEGLLEEKLIHLLEFYAYPYSPEHKRGIERSLSAASFTLKVDDPRNVKPIMVGYVNTLVQQAFLEASKKNPELAQHPGFMTLMRFCRSHSAKFLDKSYKEKNMFFITENLFRDKNSVEKFISMFQKQFDKIKVDKEKKGDKIDIREVALFNELVKELYGKPRDAILPILKKGIVKYSLFTGSEEGPLKKLLEKYIYAIERYQKNETEFRKLNQLKINYSDLALSSDPAPTGEHKDSPRRRSH